MPKKVDHKARREAFLAAAYRMIKRVGISGVTARSVAAEAGFTTGALVHYVKSMDELLVQASEYSARDVRSKMIEAEALPDPVQALRAVLYLALPSDPDKRGNWNFFLGFWERSVHNAAVRKLTHARYREWLSRVERLLEGIRAAGRLPKDVDLRLTARAGVALIDGIAIQVMRSGEPPTTADQRELVDRYIEHWVKPLAVRRPAQKSRKRVTAQVAEKEIAG